MPYSPQDPVEPRPAAALILVDGEQPARVLLARRNESLAFMGGQYCFPGGRIHQDEGTAHIVGDLEPYVAAALHAAVRETFEETGLLCVEGTLPPPEVLRAARAETLERAGAFDELLAAHQLWIHAEDFDAAGFWVTPPVSPMRFRTHYFLYRYRKPKTEEVLHGEIVDLAWLTAGEARRRWRSGQLDTSTPVGFALRQLCHYPPDQWAEALCRVPNTAAGVPGRFELRPGIHMIPVRTDTLPPATHTNCVVIGEDVQAIIDPGASDPAEQHALLEQIRHLDTGRSTILAVLLTHSHRDHFGAAAFLREALGCPVWAHAGTATQLPIAIDRHLDDGEILELPGEPAWRIHCIHTPGHDPGHLAFLEESSGVLIAGDMVANPGSIYIAPGLGGDMTAYLDSLERLKGFEFDRIVPSHGVPLHRGAKDLIDRHIHHRLRRERKVQRGLAAGLHSIEDLLRHVYDDIQETAIPLAEGNLRAHLSRLGVTLP